MECPYCGSHSFDLDEVGFTYYTHVCCSCGAILTSYEDGREDDWEEGPEDWR